MTPLNILLQITQPVPTSESLNNMSIFSLMQEGGWLMIPLLICSIIALYIFIERLIKINQLGQVDNFIISDIKSLILEGNIEGAKSKLKQKSNSTNIVLAKGLSRLGKSMEVIEKTMENAGAREVYKMEKRLSILSTIAGIAPMFGFLGTIAGMIILFYNVNVNGFNIKSISSGIYTKMITSGVGLLIGLLSYLAYQYLSSKVSKNINTIEEKCSEFIDILYEPIS